MFSSSSLLLAANWIKTRTSFLIACECVCDVCVWLLLGQRYLSKWLIICEMNFAGINSIVTHSPMRLREAHFTRYSVWLSSASMTHYNTVTESVIFNRFCDVDDAPYSPLLPIALVVPYKVRLAETTRKQVASMMKQKSINAPPYPLHLHPSPVSTLQ